MYIPFSPILGALHAVFALALFIGVVFLLFWAFKHFTEAQFKRWGWILILVGLVGCLLTMGFAFQGGFPRGNFMYRMMGDDEQLQVMGQRNDINKDASIYHSFQLRNGQMGNMDDMMKEGMMKGTTSDPMDMSMSDMSATLEGKTGDDFDKAFLEEMIPHHQGAVDMANMALTSAKHQEIKNLARQILSSQQREINQMNAWMKAWGYSN